MPEATLHFPSDFRWGCATAAHQVEGDNTNNDWYAWEQGEGHIYGQQKSGQACDWWRNAEADLGAAAMGQNAHRMSVEWSRIEPSDGRWDEAAIDRYRQMLRFMRERGMEPMIALHHFTTPLWLVEQGGWENPRIVPRFERFATKVVESLGEWRLAVTISEPVLCPPPSAASAARETRRTTGYLHLARLDLALKVTSRICSHGAACCYRPSAPAASARRTVCITSRCIQTRRSTAWWLPTRAADESPD
jgi:hypothetical protein